MRDQGDFKSVKRFGYTGSKTTKSNTRNDEWDTIALAKPITETKELSVLNDTWSIRKNVSLEGGLLKPEGNTVQAPPSGSGFYSRHGQHNSLKSFEELRSTPGFNSTGQAGTTKSFSLNQQRAGYSYSQPEAVNTGTSFPMLTSSSVGGNHNLSRYGETTHGGSNPGRIPGGGVGKAAQLGMNKPGQFGNSSSQLSSNRTSSSGSGKQWPSF
ncbi:uncharacterized protein LOC117296933 [Asterias rubens]|uniref:uncharacterized protein LOC117296933 n=1 Tax=Asterias rubens TaxID=7604 RepID=UPI0014555009|nr:uncharacterized protein LOC117296933 [Asterias rubens]